MKTKIIRIFDEYRDEIGRVEVPADLNYEMHKLDDGRIGYTIVDSLPAPKTNETP